ncbi:MAG TPA: serine/threonine-protein kinase [Kofleriaceae bacterium]|nr:serine/threonine-protein kinase [Kofleriaceae bacterium]
MADSSPLALSPTLSAARPAGSATEQLAAGAKVGDYVVERFIGAGAMGEVYAGKHPVIGKRVAIKVLRHELAASAEAAERFIREARAVNQVDHDNVVDVFAFGRLDDGRLYLVMDLVEGRSLRAHLVDGPLPLDRALAILDTIADALDAAHAKGVVHRDLKPDNIVLSNATPPKVFVLDFGIAKLVSKANEGDGEVKTGPGTLTGQGTWLGTPSYMAPEQWSVDGAGPASDRYALGIIAFELLTGAPPFSASSVPAMMEQHFRGKVPAVSTRGAVGVPAAVDAVLERALAKDPEARYASAKQLVEELRNASGTGVHRPRGAIEKGGGRSSTRNLVPALAGVGVLGAAIIAYVAIGEKAKPVVAPKAQPAVATDSSIRVTSEPSDAEVKENGNVVGKTPLTLPVAAATQHTLTVAKPGYVAETKTVQAGQPASFSLTGVTGFNGTWRMKNGELRWFERIGEQVSVYKLTEVAGPREFFKHYKFTPADKGITFGADDEIVDPRKPDDPGCHVPVHVEYRYDPQEDVLEQRREHVVIDFTAGTCVVRDRNIESDLLVHVDRAEHEVDISAPVGLPAKTDRTPQKKKVLPKDPQVELDQKQKEEKVKKYEAAKNAEAAKNVKPTPKSNVGSKQAVSDINDKPFDAPATKKGSSYSQIAPQPQVNAPTSTAEPEQQAPQQAPQKPLPQQQKK